MDADVRPPFRYRRRTWLWLALAWFVFVNGVFYWNLFYERVDELPLIWERLVAVLR